MNKKTARQFIKIRPLFIVLFILAFLPLALACGNEQSSSAPISGNAVYENSMMSGFYGANFFMPLIMILIIIALTLIIIWLIKQITNSNKQKRR